MQLTTGQLQTLRTWLNSNAVGIFDQEAADMLNALTDPAYIVWRTNVTDQEIMQNNFNWTRVDNLAVGKARIWEWMFRFGSINASNSNIRAGIDAVWVGTQADLDVRAAVYIHCKRTATKGEQLFATGTGSTVSPSTMAAEGLVTSQNVSDARNL